jgi:ankyrin repeat protein
MQFMSPDPKYNEGGLGGTRVVSVIAMLRQLSQVSKSLERDLQLLLRPKAMNFHEASKVIKKGDFLRLRNELESDLNPNLRNQYSWTLLMCAALEGNTSIGRLLIEKGADLDSRNNCRDTALSLAAYSGHPSFFKLLLQSGASLECYPFGGSFDGWLDWVGKYTACSPEQAERIRSLFDSERKHRTQTDQPRS